MPTKTATTDLLEHTQDITSSDLPVTHDLRLAYLFSLLIAVLTGIASIAGLLYPETFYPTAELRHSYLANDIST